MTGNRLKRMVKGNGGKVMIYRTLMFKIICRVRIVGIMARPIDNGFGVKVFARSCKNLA